MDKFNGEDPYGLLRGKDQIYNGLERNHAIYSAHDKWDEMYGIGKKDHEVYVLCNEGKPGKYEFGPLTFNYEPFYVGMGKRDRSKASAEVGRQRYMSGEKIKVLEEMNIKNQKVKIYIINRFYTENKAKVVESKILTLMKKSGLLTNAEFPFCDIPLKPEDYEYHANQPLLLFV